MEVEKVNIEGLIIIHPKVFPDERGYFFEAYNRAKYVAKGINASFVQDNVSQSSKNVLRGLHFQNPPYEQGKMVSVLKGSVLDVVVDIRKNSATYGQHYSIVLSGENAKQFYIPPGFAHGFKTLEDDTIFTYKCTNIYNKESEGSIYWNDPDLKINWGAKDPIVSEKDQGAPIFKQLTSKF